MIEGRGVTLTATTPTVTPLATTTHHTSPAEFWAVDKKVPRYVNMTGCVKLGLDSGGVVCKNGGVMPGVSGSRWFIFFLWVSASSMYWTGRLPF